MNSKAGPGLRRAGLVTGLGLLLLVGPAQESRSEVTPEFSVATRGVFSANYEDRNAGGEAAVSDFSDTGLLLGLRQKLYSNWRSRFVLGMQFPDADSELGQIFYHQVFIQVEDRSNIVKLGRSRLRGSLVEFPTLRDDDALSFTDLLNPLAIGNNTEDSQFGNVIEYTRLFGPRVWLTGHGEHYAESNFVNLEDEEDFSLNSVGGQLEYRVPTSQRWNRDVIQYLGVGVNTFSLDEKHLGRGREETLASTIAAAVINLHPDPVHLVDFRTQVIYNGGLDGLAVIRSPVDLALARSTSVFASLRYLKRTLERPAFQVALSVGFKEYPELEADTRQWQVIGNGAVRLGAGLDFISQVQYGWQEGDLANLLGEDQLRVQAGFVYGFERVFNAQFGDRESLLGLEHGYIP